MNADINCCAFATMHLPWPWLRQTEDGCGGMAHARFLLNESPSHAQWLVVIDEPPANFETYVPTARRVLFITEPPEVKVYPPSYLRQFGYVVSPYGIRGVASESLLQENSCLAWHLGVNTAGNAYTSVLKNLAEIRHLSMPEKKGIFSVICSTKTFTLAQRKRITFVKKLQAHFGEVVDVYGRGHNPIPDKALAILPYKYHLVLENSYLENSWTEKLSDTWLGYTYPIYLGASNIESCSLPGAMLVLQPDNEEANINAIAKLLQEDPWESSLPALRKCRQWVLETTNVFARIDRMIHGAGVHMGSQPNLSHPVPLRQSSRWQRALLRRALRAGLYNPIAR